MTGEHPSGSGYSEGHLQQLLAEDPRIAELGIRVVALQQGGFALHGEVESAQRRAQIEQVVAESFPGLPVRCEIAVTRTHEPDDVEEL
jgi:hypothetical protein